MSEIYTDDYNCLNSADGHLTGIEYTTIKVWSSIGARSLEDLLYVVPIEDDRDQGAPSGRFRDHNFQDFTTYIRYRKSPFAHR